VPNAIYRNHGAHAEAIEIIFNPDEMTYRDLLEFFFQISGLQGRSLKALRARPVPRA